MIRLWDRTTRGIFAESALFLEEKGAVALLFPAAKITRVYNQATGKVFTAGKDFSHTPGSDRIFRTEHSEIPFLDDEARHPSDAVASFYPAPDANAVPWGVDGRNIRFDAGNFFATQQIEVDYEAASGNFSAGIDLFPERLPRLKQKLARKENLRLRWLGDSISEGYNASGYLKKAPFQPPMAGLFAAALQEDFSTSVELDNRGLNGAESSYPLENPPLTDARGIDLVAVAFGMNDFYHEDPALYLENISEIIRRVRKSNSGAEILLLTAMSGNPDWKHTPPEPARIYAENLIAFARKQDDFIAAADLYQVWQRVLRRKDFFDLTGNGVNHPNDYGHRILANTALSLFTPDRMDF
ncbi:MAG: SGNH/GDSL hydrolase family protein [Victivallaceae bacterium]|nr:SGNH/GDSL hydrolase family protein [Victivallaceae bacterium]